MTTRTHLAAPRPTSPGEVSDDLVHIAEALRHLADHLDQLDPGSRLQLALACQAAAERLTDQEDTER